MPMRFQAAFGRGTRGQQVPTLLFGVFCTVWERQPENLGFLVFRLPFVYRNAVFRGMGCVPMRFQAAFGGGMCGQRVPTLPVGGVLRGMEKAA